MSGLPNMIGIDHNELKCNIIEHPTLQILSKCHCMHAYESQKEYELYFNFNLWTVAVLSKRLL